MFSILSSGDVGKHEILFGTLKSSVLVDCNCKTVSKWIHLPNISTPFASVSVVDAFTGAKSVSGLLAQKVHSLYLKQKKLSPFIY